MVMARRAAGAALGLAADAVLGEAPDSFNPVAIFGRMMLRIEALLYRDNRRAGVAHLAAGVGLATLTGSAIDRSKSRSARLAASATACYAAVAGNGLARAAVQVQSALDDGDLAWARCLLNGLVGRNTSTLDEKEISRAVIESVAENTVDGVVAPMIWTVVAGPVGALGYRAVNTMDSMVGHRSERYRRYGWAPARADDAANWLAARLTAGLVMAIRPRNAGAVYQAIRRDARFHPSPNSGMAEAAFAAALGLRLGGLNTYGDRVEVRPSLGDGAAPSPADITAAVTLARQVWVALAGILVLPAAVRAVGLLHRSADRRNLVARRSGKRSLNDAV